MARQARIKSKTGIYHVMLRGNERKAIFGDEDDKNKFIDIIFQKKEATNSFLYSYCIMDNHAHMVIRELEYGQPIEILMKRIGVAYALYFNKKYERVGHVFQDRFRSEVVEDEGYLLSVIRYIHQNPVKAGICQGLEYPWSSYLPYIGVNKNSPLLPEMADILGLLSESRMTAVKNFISFHDKTENHLFLDEIEESNVNQEKLEEVVENFLSRNHLSKKDLSKNENRDLVTELIEILVYKTNLSGRQVADLVGLNREKVRRMIVSKEPSP